MASPRRRFTFAVRSDVSSSGEVLIDEAIAMNASAWAVGLALAAGTLRAVQLWRAGTRVDVVNSVVLSTLAEGRGQDLASVLRKSGSGLYLEVARRIAESLGESFEGTDGELRERLDREGRAALLHAMRRLQRASWLDHVALIGILFAGVAALTGQTPSAVLTVELAAATLLWFSNLYGARGTATRLFAGATALVDSLVEARRHLDQATPPDRLRASTEPTQ